MNEEKNSIEIEHCTLGSFDVVQREQRDLRDARNTSEIAMMARVGDHIPAWNDQDGQTAGNVIDELLMAAKDLRNSVNEDSE